MSWSYLAVKPGFHSSNLVPASPWFYPLYCLPSLSVSQKFFSHKTHSVPLPQRKLWHPTPVFLPGKSHGRRSLVGCSAWGLEESDMTEWLHFHFSLSFIGEGNGNPLQCSCLGNPRDGGAWWAADYGVAQSRTWLKWLSSSSSPSTHISHLPLPRNYLHPPRHFCPQISLCWHLSRGHVDVSRNTDDLRQQI